MPGEDAWSTARAQRGRRSLVWSVLALAVVIGAAGCAASGAPTRSGAAPTSEPAPPESPSTARPSPTVNFLEPTVPEEMAGTWVRTIDGDRVEMSLVVGYTIRRGSFGRATGHLNVEGDRIEFFDSSVCEGTGAYTWSIEGDVLRFKMIGVDPCSGRSEVLVPGTFRRFVP